MLDPQEVAMFGSLVPWRERPLFPITERFPRAMARMGEEMEELMERLFRPEEWGTMTSRFVPHVNVAETEKEFEVTVELPGLKPEQVKVELKNGELWIEGERKEENEEKGKTFHRVERSYGEFRRVIGLPSAVEEEKIEAKFEHGLLTITAPKTEEAKPKHIQVKA
jgi:HSP20 family protein